MSMFLHAGHRFDGPGGQFYELAHDVERFSMIKASDFTAGGGAPEPCGGTPMPHWLHSLIQALSEPSAYQRKLLAEAMRDTVLIEEGGAWVKVHCGTAECAHALFKLLTAAKNAGEWT